MNRVCNIVKRSFIIVALLSGICFAQTPQPVARDAILHGSVFDAVTEDGLSGATISLQDLDRRTVAFTQTDARGDYELNPVPEGVYYLHAELAGYVAWDYGQRTAESSPSTLTISASADSDFSFNLLRAGTISGQVLDAENRPVTDAEVRLMTVHFNTEGKQVLATPRNLRPVRTVAGNYIFDSVPPGQYYIRAASGTPTEGGVNPAPINYNFRTYYPGGENASEAASVEMPKTSADLTGINFTFRNVPRFSVTGTLAYPEPQEIVTGRQEIYLVSTDAPYSRLVDPPLLLPDFDDRDNVFELREVPSGSYDLYIAATADEEATGSGTVAAAAYVARLRVEVLDRDVSGLVAMLNPGIDLHGEFRLDNSAQLSGLDLSGARPVFIPLDGKPAAWTRNPGPEGNVQVDGSFDLRHIPEGQYSISATVPKDLYLDEAWLGSRSVLGKAVDIDQGTLGPLVFQIRDDGGRFEGTVTEAVNSPAADAIVVLVQPSEFRGNPAASKTAVTDGTGHFLIDGIRPGTYTAFAFAKIEDNAWLNEEFMVPYQSAGVPITVDRNSHTYRNLRLVPIVR